MRKARHIAIIMDGNGRWACNRQHARAFGHVKGARRVREITRYCAKQGLEALTLYTFSTENWQRPSTEVNFLMKLLLSYLKSERSEILNNNIRFRTVGFSEMMPQKVQDELKQMEKDSENNTGMVLSLALSYGSRQELTNAVKEIAREVKEQDLNIEDINEDTVSSHLFTKSLPEPDLLIRTGGDKRISNFLLWQIAYAEFYFTDCCWPDFNIEKLNEAISVFEKRERRYGLTGEQIQQGLVTP